MPLTRRTMSCPTDGWARVIIWRGRTAVAIASLVALPPREAWIAVDLHARSASAPLAHELAASIGILAVEAIHPTATTTEPPPVSALLTLDSRSVSAQTIRHEYGSENPADPADRLAVTVWTDGRRTTISGHLPDAADEPAVGVLADLVGLTVTSRPRP